MGRIADTIPNTIKGEYDEEDPIIDVHNWRAISEDPSGLIIIVNTCERFFIHGLTMERLHVINDNDETVDMVFDYMQENLACSVCHGRGVLDWVDNITKHVQYEDGMSSSYKRNPLIPSKELDDFYISTPILDTAHIICEVCCGTGLHMFNENAYLLKIESERSHYHD